MEKLVRDFFESSKRVTLISKEVDEDFNSDIDLPKEKEILKKVFLRFHNVYLSNYIQNAKSQNKTEIETKVEEIENIIEKTRLDFKLTKKQKDCVKSLFDIYIFKLMTTGDIMKAGDYIINMLKSYK